MKIAGWLARMFGMGKEVISVKQRQDTADGLMEMGEFAYQATVDLVAALISKSQWITYLDGKPVQGEEHYRWNYSPNDNQTASQFLWEVVQKLLCQGDCLVVELAGQLIIADRFVREEGAVRPDRFTSVSRGAITFRREFWAGDVLYFRLSPQDARQVFGGIAAGYGELLSLARGKYRRSGGRKGILKISKTEEGTEERKEKLDDLLNNRFRRYFTAENAVLPLSKGFEYTETSSDSKYVAGQLGDVTTVSDEMVRRASQALRLPPSLMTGQVADTSSLMEDLMTTAVEPICRMMAQEINRKRYGRQAIQRGSYLKIDTSRMRHVDPFKVSGAVDRLIACGVYSIDGVRIKLGEEPLNTPWSRRHWITKNYEAMEGLEHSGQPQRGEVENG